jgi:hypothetical protein
MSDAARAGWGRYRDGQRGVLVADRIVAEVGRGALLLTAVSQARPRTHPTADDVRFCASALDLAPPQAAVKEVMLRSAMPERH